MTIGVTVLVWEVVPGRKASQVVGFWGILVGVERGGYRSPGPPPPPQPGMVPLEAATPSQALQGLWVLAVLARG